MFSRAVGREGRCKQITLACAHSVSATLGLPPLTAHAPPCPHSSASRLLRWDLSEAGPELYALPKSKTLRFRHSGSPQRRRLSWACVLCPSQVRAAQVTRCLVSAVPAAWFSGCTTSAPSQADVDRPESQEVLVSNEACLQFGR